MANRNHDIRAVTLAANVATGGTFSASYPNGKMGNDYRGGDDHIIISASATALFAREGDFSLTFGASQITVNLLRGRGFSAGEVVYLHLDRAAIEDGEPLVMANPERMAALTTVRIALGAPVAASANAIALSQSATLAAGLATGINGALAAGGVATLDVPRNVVAAWTGAAVLTVTGTDEYGNVMRESSASGVSFTGAKAFKTITGITVSANVTGLTVGTGVRLGLPVFLSNASEILRELQDGAAATAGTVVPGDTAVATATTGDVRGTYVANSAPNGTLRFEVIAALRSPESQGNPQFAG